MVPSRLPSFVARRRLRAAAALSLTSLAALSSALIWLTPRIWFGELLASFEFHFGLCALAAALALVGLRAPRLALVAAGIGCAHLAGDVLLWHAPSIASPTPVAARLRVVSANVLQPNRHCAEIAAALRESDADVIGVVELSGPMRATLERELAAWPHRVVATPAKRPYGGDTWTTGIFSKLPLEQVRFVQLFDCYAPLIEARVTSEGESVLVRLVHLPRPGSRWRIDARNQALEQLARQFEWGPRVLLVGDLNTTSSSPAFDQLLDATGLSDTRQGFGRQPTWWLRSAPSLRRAGAPQWLASVLDARLGIAIDHALAGADLLALGREVFELPFSDHAGVLVDLAVSRAGQ